MEYLERFLFGWIDGGLFCRKLPTDSQLEAEIENYFAKDAPHINALPSFKMGTREEGLRLKCKFKNMKIISVEENVQWGYGIMPCPNLYEYPMRSLHINRFGLTWGNGREMERTPQSQSLKNGKRNW
ncbi:hypothetical protein [Cricetibacter osteomyelitidis]|uniref:hypothetical protein n=1 Tax=Cricetibacter osteomyelitidis TaxID=1521931 RepID=UPI001FB51134|nr:hypothetical protein [Cricetibacter osteomyelitidis]